MNESSSAQDVNLQLTRQGSSGQAIISWSIIGVSSSFTAGDVAATSGTVQMDDGKMVNWCMVDLCRSVVHGNHDNYIQIMTLQYFSVVNACATSPLQ